MAGKYFEELELGARFAREPGRTVAEADNLLFTALTLNPQLVGHETPLGVLNAPALRTTVDSLKAGVCE